MIKNIDITNPKNAEELLGIQIPSYTVEAELIGTYEIPPLQDTVQTLQQSDEIFYGYYLNEELYGAIAIKIDNQKVDIHRLIVHPKHFRKGIAQHLLDFVTRMEGIKTLIVSTGTKNIPAVNFYKKNGFQLTKKVMVNEHLSLSFFIKEKNFISLNG